MLRLSLGAQAKAPTLSAPPGAPLRGTGPLSVRALSYAGCDWIDIPQPSPKDLKYLEAHYPFHPLDFEDLLDEPQRAKVDEYDDYLFLVLHFPVFDREVQVTRSAELDIFVGKDFLITLRKGPVWPIDRLFEACLNSQAVQEDNLGKGPGYLLYRLLDKLVDNALPVAHKIERNAVAVENEIFHGASKETIEQISRLRRDIIAFERVVKPMIPVIARLESHKTRLIGEDLEVYYSDIGDALGRIYDMLEDQKGIVEALNDTYGSLTTHRTNETIRVLTVISVLMLPLNLISGIYGMNLEVPFAHVPHAFLVVVVGMCMVSVAMIVAFRFKRWL